MKRKHPIQPVVLDEDGRARFVENRIVRFLLDQYGPGLQDLSVRFGSGRDDAERADERADWEQLFMLIGYSVSGFADLEPDRRTLAIVDRKAARLAADRSPAARSNRRGPRRASSPAVAPRRSIPESEH